MTWNVRPVLMNISNQDRQQPVILSAAKNLRVASEILRCAQNDIPGFDRKCSSGRLGRKRPAA
jgi:hypothetical protein